MSVCDIKGRDLDSLYTNKAFLGSNPPLILNKLFTIVNNKKNYSLYKILLSLIGYFS